MSHNNAIFKHMRRSPYQSLAAIFMTSITFMIITVFGFVTLGSARMLSFFESRPQVTAFFKDDTSMQDVDELKNSISQVVVVDAVKYLSKEDALNIYKKQNEGNPLLLEMVTADILPASLEVSAKNVDDLETIATVMQKNSSVEEVVFQKDVIDALRKWVKGIRLAGITLSLLLSFASLATIVIILGLKFSAKRTEIKTLSLLGATSWYIRGPFVLEGIVYGVFGAIIGFSVSYLTLLYLTPNLVGFFEGIPMLPVPVWILLSLLGIEAVFASIIGATASLIATRRYGR